MMIKLKKFLRLLSSMVLIAFITGCTTVIGPERIVMNDFKKTPLLKLDKVTETLTGTWATLPGAGFKSGVLNALKQPPASTLFTQDERGLPTEIALTTDHEDDGPRLLGLGVLSVCTIGILPLNYFSQWKVTGKIFVRKTDGALVAEFPLEATPTYNTWAFPLTMFTLLGCAFKGNSDSKEIMARAANGIASQLMDAVSSNYVRLANAYEANSPASTASSRSESQAASSKMPDLM